MIMKYCFAGFQVIEEFERMTKLRKQPALSMVLEKNQDSLHRLKNENKHIQQLQHHWSSNKHNNLLKIKPTVGGWEKKNFWKTQKVEVVLSRIRIGHTGITHSYLRRVTNVSCNPDCIYNKTCSHWMHRFGSYNRNISLHKQHERTV